ncbi:MAG: hypothetical protein JWO35_142 [Candidatus Saccharibacteria bacterium]|nr:hypothetical protein [Candidatus Saccharibacteria bacterium]
MKTSALKYSILSWVSGLSALILLLMPFHAFLTVWASSFIGHYTALRLWKEVILLIIGLGTLFLIAIDHKIRSHTLTRRLVWLILSYVVLNVLYGLYVYSRGDVSAKALGYGLIVDLRFPLFFLVTWATALRTRRLRYHWQGLVLWAAGGVVLLGLLQAFILPNNFLSHFGYGASTIDAFETINSNNNYVRVASTLRGANPLGAYLIVPITVLTMILVRTKLRRNWQFGLLGGALIALFFSFSRSAWIGAAVAVAVVLGLSLQSKKLQRQVLVVAGVSLIALAGLGLALRDNSQFQNVFFHTEDKSVVKTSSNDGHLSALKDGVSDIAHEPLGGGPGTAGPASVYNPHETRIAENYFIQIGQETGLLGMALFILINIGVGYLLWSRRADPLALSLFASLIGLTLVNLLSHAWADDTLAYVWWGLAGIAMAPSLDKTSDSDKADSVKDTSK